MSNTSLSCFFCEYESLLDIMMVRQPRILLNCSNNRP